MMEASFAVGLAAETRSTLPQSSFLGRACAVKSRKDADRLSTFDVVSDGSRYTYFVESPPPRFAPKVNHPGLAVDPLGRTMRSSMWDNRVPSGWDDNITFLYRASWYDTPPMEEGPAPAEAKKPGPKITSVVSSPSPSPPRRDVPIVPSVSSGAVSELDHPYLLPRDDSAFETAVYLFDFNWWRDAESTDPNWWRRQEPFAEFREVVATASKRRQWAARERCGREDRLRRHGVRATKLPMFAYS
mmetsp:Transcript_11576/g.20174  ORF Transcript_11576/g.20174 Transcript_11576/m.20174 type:complete len:244 (+) Transcript_11576:53-784(+)